MRGNPSNTISPFILFSAQLAESSGPWAPIERAVAKTLRDAQVPFKPVTRCIKGRPAEEHLLIVDSADVEIAKELARSAGSESISLVDLNRVGVRVSLDVDNPESEILGTLENASVHALDDGAAYLQDAAGTTWAWT